MLGDEVAVLREPADDAWTHTRVRPAPGESWPGGSWSGEARPWESRREGSWAGEEWAEEPAVAPEPPPAVPQPGRHAARRRRPVPRLGPVGRGPSDGETSGRGLLGPAQLTVVAVLVALGLAVTCWWLLRSGSEPVPLAAQDAPALVTPAAVPGGEPGAPAGDPPADGSSVAGQPEAGSLVVDVAGKVRRPGIAVLEPGARVVDAIEAAGGARRGVDLSSLNLARPLVDGEQILVGVPGGPPPAPAGAGVGGDGAGGGLLVNINTAGQAELETLPEVGPVTAQAIIAWREQHGGFSSIDQLVEVDGIGEATLATVSPFVTV